MTWFTDLRLKESKNRPILRDIRSLYFDNIGISIAELRRIDNDEHYIAKASTYAQIILYFNDPKIKDSVCTRCPIEKKSMNILKTDDLGNVGSSKYNKDKKKIDISKNLVKDRKREQYIFQNSRLRYSIKKNKYFTVEDVSVLTSIPQKKIYKVEKKDFLIDDLEEASLLLATYHDSILSKQICLICPVSIAENKVKNNVLKEEM